MPVANQPPALEFLLVSNDHSALTTVKSGIDGAGASFNCTTTTDAARLYINRHRLDAVILDVGVSAAGEFIGSIRRGGSNRRAFVFVCANNDTESAQALKAGANAILQKPLKPEKIIESIRTFRGIMLTERRRFFRYHVTIPVSLTVGGNECQAMIDNLSQGGMAVLMNKPLGSSAMVDFSFELPFGPRLNGTAQVVWSNQKGFMGLEFRTLRNEGTKHLTAWLKNQALSV